VGPEAISIRILFKTSRIGGSALRHTGAIGIREVTAA
jgi:hypothetical protein